MWVMVGSILKPVEMFHGGTKTKTTILTIKSSKEGAMRRTDYFERKLDDKRRLTIPSDIREEFVSGIVVTRGFGKYLHIYPKPMWDQDIEKFADAINWSDEESADKIIKFRIGKSEAELDSKQGRVTFEKQQLDYAGITSEVVAVRVGEYWRVMSAEVANAL